MAPHTRALLGGDLLLHTLLPDAVLIVRLKPLFTPPSQWSVGSMPFPRMVRAYALCGLVTRRIPRVYRSTVERRYGKGHAASVHLEEAVPFCAIEDGKKRRYQFRVLFQTGIPHQTAAGDTDPYILPIYKRGDARRRKIKRQGKAGGYWTFRISNDLRSIERGAVRQLARQNSPSTCVNAIVKG